MSQASRTFRTFSAPSYQKWAFCHFMPTDSPTSANHCRPGSFQVNKNWAEKTRLTRPDKKQEIGYNKKEHSGKSTAKLAPPAVSLAWMFFSFWLREPSNYLMYNYTFSKKIGIDFDFLEFNNFLLFYRQSQYLFYYFWYEVLKYKLTCDILISIIDKLSYMAVKFVWKNYLTIPLC